MTQQMAKCPLGFVLLKSKYFNVINPGNQIECMYDPVKTVFLMIARLDNSTTHSRNIITSSREIAWTWKRRHSCRNASTAGPFPQRSVTSASAAVIVKAQRHRPVSLQASASSASHEKAIAHFDFIALGRWDCLFKERELAVAYGVTDSPTLAV